MTDVLVIAFDGEVNPSTRLRILQYVPALESQGFRFDTHFVSQQQGVEHIKSLQRLLESADIIFVQRVLTQRLLRLLRRAGKPVVFDLDDAVHYVRQSQYPRALNPKVPRDRLLVAYRTIARGNRYYSSRKRLLDEMLALATVVIVGNRWLFDDLQLTEGKGMVLPTAVWLDGVPCKAHEAHLPITLGWIGVQSNLLYLKQLDDVFRELHGRFGDRVELKVVSSAPFDAAVPTRFVPWSLETEGDSVLTFDIGLMPLQDDPFSRGKCAFKAVFYMSRGVPVVASPVGANSALVIHGENGYLASKTTEWVACLSTLVEDASLRALFGWRARQAIEMRFSAGDVAVRLREALERAQARNQEAVERTLRSDHIAATERKGP